MKNRIAIIDTGVDINNAAIIAHVDKEQSAFLRKDDFGGIALQIGKDAPNCFNDNIGHGTAVCGIALSHNPELEIVMVKIFSDLGDDIDEDILIAAMNYIHRSVDCRLVNMSVGVTVCSNKSELYDACALLRRRNTILVSAFDNAGAISYPAHFDNVIGVTNADECTRNTDYYLIENSSVNVGAKGRAQRVHWLSDQTIVTHGNSYACAHFAGILSLNAASFADTVTLQKRLTENAKGTINAGAQEQLAYMQVPKLNGQRIIAFPFNKEIHSIVRFSHLLVPTLVDVYDTKYSALIGASTNRLLNESCQNDFIIKNIEDIDWSTFDVFVLGHIDEYIREFGGDEYKRILVNKILNHGKCIYSFDDISRYCDNIETHRMIFSPRVTASFVPDIPFGKLFRSSIPTVGVFGTSSKQGKFTLQLRVREEFLSQGYRPLQIGTEPSAILFGMDIVFPIGYNSLVEIHNHETVAYLNHLINEHSENCDLLIVGGQSGLVPYDFGNLSNIGFHQTEILYASQPDIAILCINATDEIGYIERSIRFLEASVGCKVIALCLFPLYRPTEASGIGGMQAITSVGYFDLCKVIFEKFGLPLYLQNDRTHISEMCQKIIEEFS